jgi:hypothetical protein
MVNEDDQNKKTLNFIEFSSCDNKKNIYTDIVHRHVRECGREIYSPHKYNKKRFKRTYG